MLNARRLEALDPSLRAVARAVAAGLAVMPRSLPPWLFYDEAGSALFERITELPEYYPTRAEREIFERDGDALVAAALGAGDATFVELGAGSAQKTQVLLEAAVRQRGAASYVPVDVSATALDGARARLAREVPAAHVDPWVMTHDDALPEVRALPGRKVVLFIGSSIGNYEGDEAIELLSGVRRALGRRDVLVLGTDLRKDASILVPAYDDAAGVTAAFNKNVLARINRELGGHFELDRFRHVALWNDLASRVEMHLESRADQVIAIDALDVVIRVRKGERIHTESSVKYDEAMVDALLRASGFRRSRTFQDAGARFAVHLCATAP
jgi:L-histidine N-alpha-methyltransferase